LAAVLSRVWDRIHLQPPGAAATLGLLLLYLSVPVLLALPAIIHLLSRR
jgi:hypothetical protein